MKTTNRILFKNLLLPVLSAWLLSLSVAGQDVTDKRSVSRGFSASADATLELDNKYGKIQMVTWEKDSILIDVQIFMTESSPSRLRKLKDDIRIDFTGTQYYIIARTLIRSERGRIASELKSISNTLTGSNKKVEINYRVHVPEYLDVVMKNKFGDIYIDDLNGRLDIDLSNGALKANSLMGNSSVRLSFANAMISNLGSCTMSLSYSDLDLGSAGQLDLDSKSSVVHADRINVLKINSRRDKMNIQQVEYLYGTGSFSQVWIYDFIRESDLYMKYGNLTLEHVMPGFSKINLESDYTDITLVLDPECALNFDILYHEKAELRMPSENTERKESFDGDHHYRSTGWIGKENASGTLKIAAMQKCYIQIAYK